MKEHEPITCTF